MDNETDYRLPRSVVPDRYDLVLTPDLGRFTFEGRATIGVRVIEPTDSIVLNTVELDVTSARVRAGEIDLTPSIELDTARERLVLGCGQSLPVGEATLELVFTGILNDQLAGFYRSTFKDEAGAERVIATTQFESTDARRAFPCFDEPDFKAVFGVTLVIDESLTAISNGPTLKEEPASSGRKAVIFADTMPMSTYLVAFIVGPLELTEPVDVDGVPLRVATVPGRTHLAGFALESGAHALRFFADYFGVAYPAEKLDLIALPDFAFGAMENLGAVTFRETALLVDPDAGSRLDHERVADVVSHEIAHMWFGDLVTMKWWNGIWLNEAFATFMELHAVDTFRPDWQRWVSFASGRSSAMTTDGMATTRPVEFPVARPEEAEGMFDVLTYQKGASVVRMLEQYLGYDDFRSGIRAYMAKHAYGNTETTDLWDAIEGATSQPVRSMMDTWIFQGGYPVVSVELAGDHRSAVLQQTRFRYVPSADDPSVRWDVPVLWRTDNGEGRVILDGSTATVAFDQPVDWLVINSGGSGFYRTRYAPGSVPPRDQLSSVERYNLVSDAWAMAWSGRTPVAEYVALIEAFGDETDATVWSTISGGLHALDRMVADADRSRLQAFVRTLARPAFDRLGWQPAAGESEKTSELRGLLVDLLGTVGDDGEVRDRAAQLHEAYLQDRSAIPADLAAPVLAIVSSTGGEAEYTAVLDTFRHPANPQEEVRYLYALANFEHEGLVRRTLDMALSGEVRTQNAPFMLSFLLANRVGGPIAWQWLKDHWTECTDRWPDNSHSRMLATVPTLARTGLAADVHAFLADHPVKAGEKTVAQTLETLDINLAFLERERDTLGDAFPKA